MSEMIDRCIKVGRSENSEFARWGAEEQFEFIAAIISAVRDVLDEKHDMTSEHWSTVDIINAALKKVSA